MISLVVVVRSVMVDDSVVEEFSVVAVSSEVEVVGSDEVGVVESDEEDVVESAEFDAVESGKEDVVDSDVKAWDVVLSDAVDSEVEDSDVDDIDVVEPSSTAVESVIMVEVVPPVVLVVDIGELVVT